MHRTSYSRLALVGRLSSHRVRLNDPSNRAFLRHPVSSLASRPSEERELAPLVHIVQAALSPSVAHPKATPVAIRPVGAGLNPTKGTSFASDTVRDQFLVAPLLLPSNGRKNSGTSPSCVVARAHIHCGAFLPMIARVPIRDRDQRGLGLQRLC